MSELGPTEDRMRIAWALFRGGGFAPRREFDWWLERTKQAARAEGWEDGLEAGCDRWMDSREFGDPPVNPHETGDDQ